MSSNQKPIMNKNETSNADCLQRLVRPQTRGYTEKQAEEAGMKYSQDKQCPECGCPWYGNENNCGTGHRTCCDCYQEWWTDINYTTNVPRRELPVA